MKDAHRIFDHRSFRAAFVIGLIVVLLLASNLTASSSFTDLTNSSSALKPGYDVRASSLERPSMGYAPAVTGGQIIAKPVVQRKPASFVSHCKMSHRLPDDPIVHPNHAGASHMHDFFGNTSTSASSTYRSLVRHERTSCRIPGDTAAYWIPTLYDDGKPVRPEAHAYYFTGSKGQELIQAFPPDLRMIASHTGGIRWGCRGGEWLLKGQREVPQCPRGMHLVERIAFPDCWNGTGTDSADHRSHVAYSARGECPASHPVPMPRLRLSIHYDSDGGDISLGSMKHPLEPHADFINAWEQPRLEALVTRCLNAGVACGGEPNTQERIGPHRRLLVWLAGVVSWRRP